MRYTLIALFALLSVLPVSLGVTNIPEQPGTPPPKTLHVAAVQMRSSRDLDANVERTIQHLKKCAADGVQVAVFPECSVSGYFDDYVTKLTAEQLQTAERRLAAACKEYEINAVVGMPIRDGDKLFNSAVVISSSGKLVERYHKVQLAERWPTPGDHLSMFKLAGVPCSIIICHDERYPELVRLPVLAGARVVFYISHESGLKQEAKINPYRAQIQARAVENGVYIVHANAPANDDLTGSHGQSRVIAPDGNLLGEASMFKEEVVTAKLDLTKANAGNAQRSITRGPLQGWWKEGVKQVRIIE